MRTPTTETLAAPTLLVAMPQLSGGPFGQAVLLLVRHDDESSMGLVLNHTTAVTLQAFCDGLNVPLRRAGDALVHVGGPVEPERAFILHASAHRGPETKLVLPPVALSFSMESLGLIADAPPDAMRVCVGYAGWGPGQLAREISGGSWMVAPASAESIFAVPPQQMWHHTLQQMGIEPLQLHHSSTLN